MMLANKLILRTEPPLDAEGDSTFLLVTVRTENPMEWPEIATALHKSVQAWYHNYPEVRQHFGEKVTLDALAEVMEQIPGWIEFAALFTQLHRYGVEDLRITRLDLPMRDLKFTGAFGDLLQPFVDHSTKPPLFGTNPNRRTGPHDAPKET